MCIRDRSYEDRPGVVAKYGSVLGDAGINIAGLQIARDERRGTALSVLSVDSEVGERVPEQLAELIDAESVHSIDIVEI